MFSQAISLSHRTGVLAVGLLCLGCASSAPPLVPVSGKVTVADQVVTAGTVSYRPDSEKGNTSLEQPAGIIQPDGTYQLMTGNQVGAAPGWYRVLIMGDNFQVVDPPPSPVWPAYPEGFLPKKLIHERYLYFKQTDLKIEVKAGGASGSYDLRLQP